MCCVDHSQHGDKLGNTVPILCISKQTKKPTSLILYKLFLILNKNIAHRDLGLFYIFTWSLGRYQVIPIAHDFSHNLNEVLIILDDIQDLILLKICHIWTLCWPYRKDGGDEEGQLTCQKIFSINSFWLYQSCKEANRQKFSNDGSTNQ